MRLLAFSDEPPPADAAELVARNDPDAVVTLGDLQPDWIASLAGIGVPRLGVHGNHDGEHDLQALDIRDLHLARAEVGAWSFVGFEGCGRLWLDGQAPLRALVRRFDSELEDHFETTVSGYLSEHLGRVPDVGEVIELNGYRVEIVAVDDTRITKVAVAPNP